MEEDKMPMCPITKQKCYGDKCAWRVKIKIGENDYGMACAVALLINSVPICDNTETLIKSIG